MASWATVSDLKARFGDEYMDKISTRRKWNSTVEDYVADESASGRNAIIQLALDDAKAYLTYKMSCLFGNLDLLATNDFKIVLAWHIKLTIETLKIGGDCTACTECNAAFDEFLKCGKICDANGVCLSSTKTFFSITEAVFCCELQGRGCGCC